MVCREERMGLIQELFANEMELCTRVHSHQKVHSVVSADLDTSYSRADAERPCRLRSDARKVKQPSLQREKEGCQPCQKKWRLTHRCRMFWTRRRSSGSSWAGREELARRRRVAVSPSSLPSTERAYVCGVRCVLCLPALYDRLTNYETIPMKTTGLTHLDRPGP